MNRNGTRRVRISGGGTSTTGKPAVSAASDWYIITGRSKEQLEHEVQPLVEAFLHARGLELSQEKTSITHIENGFDVLGQNVRKYNGKLLIKPSKKNVHVFLDKIRQIIKDHKQATAGQLICLLNPVIRGWARYHRYVVSKKIFASVDRAIYDTMRRWAIRRHPYKSKHWIIGKYIRAVGGQQWIFHGEVDGRRVQLFRGSDGEANRVLLHPTCHQQVLSQKVTVSKPRPAQGDREA